MSTIAASVTATYASAHTPVRGFDATAATHGYTTVFLTSALVFAVGGVLAAALFPSKARLTEMRSAVAPRPEPETAGEPVAVNA
jgi:hypothetical protein